MAVTFGISSAGFTIPQLVDIQSEINASLMATFGADINLSPSSVFGQISGIFAEREMLIWEAMQDVYNSQYPDTAFGSSLDNVGALTAIKRLGALPTTISAVKLFGTPGTLVPATTTQFAIQNQPTNLFKTNFDVTLGTGQNCIQNIAFSAVPTSGNWSLELSGQVTGALAYNANAAAIQTAIQALPFASGCTVTGNYSSGFVVTFNGGGTGGLMGQPLFIIFTDTLVASSTPVVITPTITQSGVDQASVDVTALQTGPTVVNINSLNVIVTPISGLSAILNTNSGITGRAVESDNAYRVRRAEELQITGGSTFNAMRSKLLNVSGVSAVILFENVTNTTDSNGLPPKSFEAFVQGGSSADIGACIFGTKPLGIQPYGTNLVTVTDSQGNLQDIYYSVPTSVPVYVIAQVNVGSAYPSNGDALIASAIDSYGSTLGIGQTLIVSPLLVSKLAGIPGINSVTLLVGKSPSPTTSTNLTFAANEVATFDLSRTSVVHI